MERLLWEAITSKDFISITEFILVSRGANCEASGYQTVTSEAECHAAVPTIEAQGLAVKAEGTVNSGFGPWGCYLRHDGPLWYNKKVQSPAECSEDSKCVCIIFWPASSGKKNAEDSSTLNYSTF